MTFHFAILGCHTDVRLFLINLENFVHFDLKSTDMVKSIF